MTECTIEENLSSLRGNSTPYRWYFRGEFRIQTVVAADAVCSAAS